MQQLILIKNIEQTKLDALLYFLKSLNIEAELKNRPASAKKKTKFSLSAGMWEDYTINASELRSKAWSRNK
jgi:hypothetical protein